MKSQKQEKETKQDTGNLDKKMLKLVLMNNLMCAERIKVIKDNRWINV